MSNKKKELEAEIVALDKTIREKQKELDLIMASELEAWFEERKGVAYNYKWTDKDEIFSGSYRIEDISEESWIGNLILKVTMVHKDEKGNPTGIAFNWTVYKRDVKEEYKITKAQFNSLLKKTLKKIKLN